MVAGGIACLACLAVGGPTVQADRLAQVHRNAEWASVFGTESRAAGNSLTLVHEDSPGDTKVGTCSAAGAPPLRLGERTYERGIGVNSDSVLCCRFAQPAVRFRATVGIDRNVDGTVASVCAHVVADGVAVYGSPVLRPGERPVELDLPLPSASTLDLVIDTGGDSRAYDQADWCDARVTLADGSELWLDDLAHESRWTDGAPFSFVYGGKPSSELLPHWRRTAAEEPLGEAAVLRTVEYADTASGLVVTARARVYTDWPGVDWTVSFTNTGEAPLPLLEQVCALDVAADLALGARPVLHALKGSVCAADDWLPFDRPLASGEAVSFGAVNGRSSADSPFFTLDWGEGGVITAVGWSGQWRGLVRRDPGSVRMQVGLEDLRVALAPGESVRSPRILQLRWGGCDAEAAHNLFRQTMLAHIMPRDASGPVLPPFAAMSTSFYELNATNEGNVLSHLESARGLGLEVFWLDAYWTGPDGFPASMGNYGLPLESVEPPDRFPSGLRSVAEAVHGSGLDFLLWFEPERVASGTRIAREHPEWVLSPAGDGSGLLDLGNAEAREYIRAYLDAAIKGYGLTWLRIDYNIDPLGYWRHGDAGKPEHAGMTEMRYVEGLYRLWDDLRAANAGLQIDDCASGGRRVDLEACSRALVLWRSDNTCDMVGDDPAVILAAAIKNQVMSAGLNRYLPLSTVGQMGTDPYRFRSGFNGGSDVADDLRRDPAERARLAEAIVEAKRIRPFWLGDFHPISEVTTDPRAWCVLQYDRPEQGDGIVLGFRRDASPYAAYECALRGIDPAARYSVRTSSSYEQAAPVEMDGAQLVRLTLSIAEKPGSVLVEYSLVP